MYICIYVLHRGLKTAKMIDSRTRSTTVKQKMQDLQLFPPNFCHRVWRSWGLAFTADLSLTDRGGSNSTNVQTARHPVAWAIPQRISKMWSDKFIPKWAGWRNIRASTSSSQAFTPWTSANKAIQGDSLSKGSRKRRTNTRIPITDQDQSKFEFITYLSQITSK